MMSPRLANRYQVLEMPQGYRLLAVSSLGGQGRWYRGVYVHSRGLRREPQLLVQPL